MARYNKTSISQQLNAAQLAINNSLTDEEIMAAIDQFGYNNDKLNEGKELYLMALSMLNAHQSGRGNQKSATADLMAKKRVAVDAYQAAAKVARAALDVNMQTSLGLTGSQSRLTAGIIQAGYTLFDNASAGNLLKDYGYDAARIAAERAKIEAFDRANQAQEVAKSAAQQASQDQLAAIGKMNDWLAQYLKIAKVALRNKKQLLEKIGVIARTVKTAKQRAAPVKAAATRAAKKVK